MKQKFTRKLFSITTAITIVSLSLFSFCANKTYADDVPTHTLTIENETMNNKSGEFTYKIKILGWNTLFEDKISSFYRGSDDEICGAYLENENDINSTKIEELGEEYFGYGFYLRIFEDGQLSYPRHFEYFYDRFVDGSGEYLIYPDYIGSNTSYLEPCWNFNETTERLSVQVYNHLDLSPYGGIYVPNEEEKSPEEDYYIFTLSSNESKTIPVPEGYDYSIEQLTQDGWELVSINDDKTAINVSGVMGSENITYTFLNRKTTIDPTDPTPPENPTNPENPTPDITVPNTGKTSAEFSATKTGIILLAVIATTIRIAYLVHRYRKS